MLFDGKAFAREIEAQVAAKIVKMGAKLRIVSIVVGDDPSSALYSRLKKAAAERVGIDFDIVKLDQNISSIELENRIVALGRDHTVSGVMLQLPIKDLQGVTLKAVLAKIPLNKDVDGLRWEESGVKPATVRAILSLVDTIAVGKSKFVVLGARGAVGRPLVHFLREKGAEVAEVEWDTPLPSGSLPEGEVVISCVGKAGLVQEDMLSGGLIVIDVGMSEIDGVIVGDMTQGVYQKASIAVPVPGGVGPVTIASLLANAVDIYDRDMPKLPREIN